MKFKIGDRVKVYNKIGTINGTADTVFNENCYYIEYDKKDSADELLWFTFECNIQFADEYYNCQTIKKALGIE